MKPLPIASTLTLIGAIATWVVHDVLEARYIGYRVGPSFYVHTAHPLTVLGMQILLVAGVLVCGSALLHMARTRNPARLTRGIYCAAMALIALSIGVAAHSVISYQRVFAGLGVDRFELYAPSIMTQLYVLGMGLWPAGFALVLLQVSRFRSRKPTA
ncbi:hypothetical protein OB03_08350 [Brevundimonas sp. GN22]